MCISVCVFMWDLFDLDSILQKGDKLFKSLHKFRYLGLENLLPVPLIENHFKNADFFENKTGEIAPGAYFLSVADIINSCQQVGSGALLIGKNCVLGLLWGKSASMHLTHT